MALLRHNESSRVARHETPSNSGPPPLPATPRAASTGNGLHHGAALGDTLPPQPLKELLSAGGANLYVLSADHELIDTVQRASGEQYPVFAVADWRELKSAVESGHCGIALLDSELVGRDLLKHIAALEAHAEKLVVLVAADRAVAQELMGFLSDRRIHRLLIKPAALGITRLLIESAVNRCLQLRELANAAGNVDLNVAALRRPPLWRRALALVAIAAVLGGAVYGGLRLRQAPTAGQGSDEPAVTAATTPPAAKQPAEPPASEAAASDRFAELLRRAGEAVDAGRLAAPVGDNALDYYLTVLAADPDEPTARSGLTAVVDALFARAEAALLGDSLDAAAAALAAVQRADPGSSRLAFLQTQLERAQAARTARQAAARTPSVPPEPVPAATAAARVPAAEERTELQSLLVIATARMQRGQLLSPTGDSAFEYVNRAADIDAADPRVVRARATLAAALLDAARTALGAGNFANAPKLLAGARTLGADPKAAAQIDAELAAAQNAVAERRHAEWLTLAESRVRESALTEPAGDSALDYLRRLQSERPDFAGLAAAWDRWAAALGAKARAAIGAHDWTAAEATLKSLEQAPRSAAPAATLREQVETGRLQEQYLATAVPASELDLVEAPPVTYPPEALRRSIEGWVDLEFVVDRTGRPKGATVIAAEPTGRFEEAALTAVATYRYAPFERAGHVYDRRVRLRLRFALN